LGNFKTKLNSVIIIPTWNKLDLVKQLLEALYKQSDKNFGIIVVDNGSDDGTPEYLTKVSRESEKSDIPIWSLLLRDNRGFALTNNVALTFALEFLEFDYFILLNNDTIPEENFIKILHQKVKSYLAGSDKQVLELEKRLFPFLARKNDWKIGSFAPMVENYYAAGIIDAAGIKISPDGNAINRGAGEKIYKYSRDKEVFGPSGSVALHLKKALNDVALPPVYTAVLRGEKSQDTKKEMVWNVIIGKSSQKMMGILMPVKEIFSSRYFAYFEDVDLAYRLRLRFWGCIYLPGTKALHYHSATAGAYSPFKSYHVHRNQYFNIIRDYPSYAVLTGLYNAFKRYFYLLRSLKLKKGPTAMVAKNSGSFKVFWIVISGWGSIFANLFGLVKERYYIQSNRLINTADFYELLSCERFRANLAKMIFETHDFLTERKKDGESGKDQTAQDN
jgi:hypothetical protein